MPASPRDILLGQIRSEFDVTIEQFRFGAIEIEILRVTDPDSLLDDQTLAGRHDDLPWHPYWAEAWAASFGVAETLASLDLEDQRVLDLGCGLGITGAVAAAKGAFVVLGDHAQPALNFARWNSWPWRKRVRVQRLDWRNDQLSERFDWIVGSEILYDRNELPYLDAFWQVHLDADGRILLGDARRAISGEMLEQLSRFGWRVQTCGPERTHGGRRLRLVQLRRNAPGGATPVIDV